MLSLKRRQYLVIPCSAPDSCVLGGVTPHCETQTEEPLTIRIILEVQSEVARAEGLVKFIQHTDNFTAKRIGQCGLIS